MPRYEFTLITRSLNKTDLVTVLKRATSLLFDHGAVVEKLESLGHRDLPYRRTTKFTKDIVYASNYFLIHSFMPITTMHKVHEILQNDKDLLHSYAIGDNTLLETPTDCNLDELLKPPAYRQSVEDLRHGQRIGHYPRMRRFKEAERQWKAIPKSYPMAPPRK